MAISNERVVTWRVTPSAGLDTAWVKLGKTRLAARGRAVGTDPFPYWVSYELETDHGFVTRRLHVTIDSAQETRVLELRHQAGTWTADGVALPGLEGAEDCDLGLCPFTNTMPIRRHALHMRPGRHEFLMAWVAVPELTVHPSRQTYTHLGISSDGAQVRYESGDFSSDLTVDQDGLVIDYPQLATRIGAV